MDHLPRPLRAQRAGGPLRGIVRVPGDKGISHRALMVAGLAVGETSIEGLLEDQDVLRTAAAMRALGAEVVREGPGRWRVAGCGVGGLAEPDGVLDMGNSGTAACLLSGMLASHGVFVVMTGDAGLRRRPMHRVTDPLRACGARFQSRAGGRLPLAIQGAQDALPLEYTLPVASAQVKSALLLAGLNAPGWTRVTELEPTQDHSEHMLRHFGAEVVVERQGGGCSISLMGQPELRATDVLVPGDPSLAAFPLVAALLVPGSRVTVRGVGLNPLRTGLFATLREMGADLKFTDERLQGGEPVGDVTAAYAGLRGTDVPADRAPGMIDDYPILAAAAAFATGTTRLRSLRKLRVKEDGWLSATAALLAANGATVETEGDDLLVHGAGMHDAGAGAGRAPAGGGLVATQMDHRIAMTALVLGLATERPVSVDDPAVIETSFPGFAALMRGLGGDLSCP